MEIKFKLGIINDEVSQNIYEVAEFCKKHGLKCFEVRSVNGRSPFEYTNQDIEQIIDAAKQNNIEISAISSPFFKCNYNDIDEINYNIEKFEECAVMANKLGAKYIRGFDFWDEEISLEHRAKMYGKVIDICEKYDVYCALESDPAVHSSTPFKLAQTVEAINNPRIKVLFDPGNEIWVTGQTTEEAYDTLKPFGIVNVHIKDAFVDNQNKVHGVKVGTGVAKFSMILKKLIADGYDGGVMLETHYRKAVELTEEQLMRPGGADFSEGAYEASEESIIALKDLIYKALQELNS